jgi:hypothetical protein
MDRRLPFLAIVLGIAGLLPFFACGLAALGLQGNRGALALAAYGATVLSFLGGVHWGFALGDLSGRGDRARLGLGVVPSLIGWVALLVVPAISANVGLGLLALGFIGTVVVEDRARRAGLVPAGYMRLRYALTGVVVLVLVIVIALRLVGAHIPTSFTD